MGRVNFIEHKGKRILHVDLSGLKAPKDKIDVLNEARRIIDAQAPKSVLLLTN